MILIGLAVSGFGLTRLTAPPAPPVTEERPPVPGGTATTIPYRLILSAVAADIQISSDQNPPLHTETGNLPSSSPVVSLIVRWSAPTAAGERRFAKLVMEPPGKPTFTHVFDAAGDIDDFIELP